VFHGDRRIRTPADCTWTARSAHITTQASLRSLLHRLRRCRLSNFLHPQSPDTERRTGVACWRRPCRSSATSTFSDLVAGHVPFSTFTLSSTAPFLRAKSVNGIAVTARERMTDFPDVPTFKELGKADLVGTTWFSLSGPLGMSKDLVNQINRAVQAAVATPEVQARFRRDGLIAQPMNADEFTEFVASENSRWKSLIERVGLVGEQH
jgi:hypothetical protein